MSWGIIAPISKLGKSPSLFPTWCGPISTAQAIQAGSNRGQQYHTNGFIKLIVNSQGESHCPPSDGAGFIPLSLLHWEVSRHTRKLKASGMGCDHKHWLKSIGGLGASQPAALVFPLMWHPAKLLSHPFSPWSHQATVPAEISAPHPASPSLPLPTCSL